MANPSEMPARKLATIMFTDIAGFSKKLAENEARAFELLKTHDALIRVLTAKFDGKVIKSIGDSFMVEFQSAVNALKCAIEIQKRFWNFNRGKAESDTIRIRVGLHLGEVTIRNDDILGEGIAIASRIEAITEPNRICISAEVYNQVNTILPLRVFKIGAVELKDISKQVEVFEVLIDTIPELAKPSPTALQVSSSQQTAIATKRESEELREAKRIEETKQRLLSDQLKSEEERKKKITIHYTRAEIFFEVGELEKAEQELAEIAKLDPQQRPPTEQQRQGEENERVVQNYLTKARELFTIKELDAAEAEVNEIFRLLPLHVGAQQLLMQIEEERYRQEEKKRVKQTESTVKQITDDERKIEELLEQTRMLLQEEKFSEATFALHDLFLIDPNHSNARRLEESIRQAKQAKAELQRIEAEQSHEEQRLQELAKLQRKVEEQIQRHVHPPVEVDKSSRYKRLLYLAAVVVILAAAFFGVPRILDWTFPKTASIAILRFINAPQDSSDLDLFDALPVLLAEDFAQCEHLTVIAPSSSLLYAPVPEHLRKIASILPAEYLLVGTIQENHGRYTILICLLFPEQQKIAYVGTVEGPLSALSEMRVGILRKVLEKMEIRSSLPEISQPTNTNAFAKYLKGIRLLQRKPGMEYNSARTFLRAAVQIDSSFGLAYAALADLELREVYAANNPQFLRTAAEYAQRALRCSPNIALAYRILSTYYRLSQNYSTALSSITKSMALLPQNPDCYRELTLLALIAGKIEEASLYASNALIYDPKNTESHFTLALVQHIKQDYSAAENSYQKAQMPEENDSLLTANFVQNVWIGKGNYDMVVRYCQQVLRTSPNDYRYYYWIGRTYQLSLQIGTAQRWLEEGLAIANQVIEDDPNDAIAHAYVGLIYSRLGKFSDGEAAMNKAIQLDSGSVEVLFRNADLYSVQRNKQKAVAALDKALHQQYDFAELLNPDLSFIANEPEFHQTVTRKIEGKWPTMK